MKQKLFNKKRLFSLFYSICFMLLCFNVGWAQNIYRTAADTGNWNTAASWQMVCNLTKSRLRGIGVGGLLEGEPRSDERAWNTYNEWIREGAQVAATRRIPEKNVYVIEWAIQFERCLELEPGKFYDPKQGPVTVGLNLAVGDLDRPEDGKGNFGGFHHEQWWAGSPHTRTHKNNFGTLQIHGTTKKH